MRLLSHGSGRGRFDFDDWFKERFGATIAPYATTSDGRTALWRLELKLNAEGQEMLHRDQQEMLDEAETMRR